MSRIDILVHAKDQFHSSYFLHEIALIWVEQGATIRLLQGIRNAPDADLVVLHVQASTVPMEYLAAVRSYPASVNGHAADTSKRTVSQNLIRKPADYEGKVIVKADQSSGWPCRLFDSTDEVPEDIWASREWVVEKFLPEMQDEMYCLRTWMFLGNYETNSIAYSNEPVLKQGVNIARVENVATVPDSLREMREELAMEFGKFDYVMVDGEAVLLDASRTPSLGGLPKEQLMPRLRHLAEGVRAFL